MQILYKFFGMILEVIFNVVQNYGLSIVVFSIVTKFLMLPLLIKQTKSTKVMNELNPKLKAIQEKYKNDKVKQGEALQALYKEHNYNPASGCLPLLIQLPIILALFRVIQEPQVYVFTAEQFALIGKSFLWIPDLSLPDPIYALPIISALTTYIQTKMMTSKQATKDPTMSTMNNIMPIMIGWISLKFPSGVVLYWVIGNLFSIVQQYIMLNKGNTKEV